MYPMPYTDNEQHQLLQIARESIHTGLETGRPHSVDLNALTKNLQARRATFVTLHMENELRGCIGTIMAEQALATDTAQRAFSAAFQDYRFSPVQGYELDLLEISVSVLSPPEPMEFENESDLLSEIQPGVDGLIIEEDYNKGVFLPSVWESLPDKQHFLDHLKRKAGLPMNYWSDNIKVSRFYTEYFSE